MKKEKAKECELTLCASYHTDKTGIRVDENIDDASFNTWICNTCAGILGLKDGDDLPDGNIVNRKLRAARKQKRTGIISGAVISDDKKHRFRLWRIWDDKLPKVLFILHNPSTADEKEDDPTIRRCIEFAKSWGYGGIYVGNIFSYRATNPKELKPLFLYEAAPAENLAHNRDMAKLCALHVLAYGNPVVRDVKIDLSTTDSHWHYLALTQSGNPKHPLYLPAELKPIKIHP